MNHPGILEKMILQNNCIHFNIIWETQIFFQRLFLFNAVSE